VKVVTEASQVAVGQKARGGFIRARDAARTIMPTFQHSVNTARTDYNC